MRKELNDALEQLGYLPLRPVQETCIPSISSGKDLFIQAETGSGKTAAYLLPVLDAVDEQSAYTSALIICPTREIAVQSSTEAKRLASLTQIHVVTCIGGMDQKAQENALKHRPHIIIGTPGRLLDLLEQRLIDLSFMKTLVLDEADQILSTGQKDDVYRILNYTSDVQTVCISATQNELLNTFFPKEFETILMNNPEELNQKITAYRYITEDKKKSLDELLLHLPVTSAIIFMNHRSDALNMADRLQKKGIPASSFSAHFDERRRLQIIRKFQTGELRVLAATDAAARGLDLQEVSHIIHYDIPLDQATYIHRSGRTAHQGDSGTVISLLDSEDLKNSVGRYIFENTEDIALEEKTYDLTAPLQKEEKKQAQVQQFLIRAGKKDKIRPGDIIGALCTVVSFEEIGVLEVQDRFSTFTLKNPDPSLIKRLERLKVKGKERRVEIKRS